MLKFCSGLFHPCSAVLLACSFSFLSFLLIFLLPFVALSFSGFHMKVMAACVMSLEVLLPWNFWNKFQKVDISSSLNVWLSSPVKLSVSWVFVFQRFLIRALILLPVIGLFIIFISSWINPRGRHNNCTYLYTLYRSTPTHNTNIDRCKRTNWQ